MVTFSRNAFIAETIVFVDGISGSGKSMLGPILASMDRVEKYRLESIYEYVCRMHQNGKIATDAASVLMRIYTDEAIYKLSISREVNLRMKDNTGFLNSPFKWRYIKRLFMKDGDAALARMQEAHPILQTNTHELFPAVDLAFIALGDRLRVLEMMRHPVFMIEHWFNYVEHYGVDPRDTTLWIDGPAGSTLPWYAIGWEDDYRAASPMDKTIRILDMMLSGIDAAFARLNDTQKKQVLFVPFENFVVNPASFIDKIGKLLGTHTTSATAKVLKRQKIPRAVFTAGRGHAHHGWQKPEDTATNKTEYDRILKLVTANASPAMVDLLLKLSAAYEQKYGVTV